MIDLFNLLLSEQLYKFMDLAHYGCECLKSYDPHNLVFSVDLLLNPFPLLLLL